MNIFDEREKAFEAKYHLDEELAFKVNARRDKLLGLWVAGKLGLNGEAAERYAHGIVELDFADPRHEAMLAKLAKDLEAHGVAEPGNLLLREMDRLAAEARRQIVEEVAAGTQTISPE